MDLWSLLGEASLILHVTLILGTCLLGGWLWMRPIWLWPSVIVGVPMLWRIFDGCPMTHLENWLLGRTATSIEANFDMSYGHWSTWVFLFLLGAGVHIAYMLRRWPFRDGERENILWFGRSRS
jgi:hypothetical protein